MCPYKKDTQYWNLLIGTAGIGLITPAVDILLISTNNDVAHKSLIIES